MSKKDDSEPGSPFASPSWIASAAFVGALLVVGIFVVAGALDDESPSSEGGAGVAAPACPEPPARTEDPDLAFAQWDEVGVVFAPSLAEAGPAVVEADGFRRCFSPSESGAVVAAATYVAIGSGRPDLNIRLASESTLPGRGREAAMAQADVASSRPGVAVQIVAYRVVRFATTDAEVAIAVRATDGRLILGSVPLRWADQDWKLVVDPATGRYAELTPLQNLGGMTPWGVNG